jgi:hypothetical protein
VIEYRVTKYNPAFRDSSGAYNKDEWTSVKDIGRSYAGVMLTREEYERIENAYASAALAFLSEGGLSSLRVEGLENKQMHELHFRSDSNLPLDEIDDAIRRILREEFWCRLEGDGGFVHFGWDYYMYIGVSHPCPTARERTVELGLYVEEFDSPYKAE